jgi:hypothetical protein
MMGDPRNAIIRGYFKLKYNNPLEDFLNCFLKKAERSDFCLTLEHKKNFANGLLRVMLNDKVLWNLIYRNKTYDMPGDFFYSYTCKGLEELIKEFKDCVDYISEFPPI